MAAVQLTFPDELLRMLEPFNNVANQTSLQERSCEEFLQLLTGIGLVRLNRVLVPANDEEFKQPVLRTIFAAPSETYFPLATFKQQIAQYTREQDKATRKIGLTQREGK